MELSEFSCFHSIALHPLNLSENVYFLFPRRSPAQVCASIGSVCVFRVEEWEFKSQSEVQDWPVLLTSVWYTLSSLVCRSTQRLGRPQLWRESSVGPGLAHPPSLSDGLTLLSSVSVIVSGNQSSTNTKNKATTKNTPLWTQKQTSSLSRFCKWILAPNVAHFPLVSEHKVGQPCLIVSGEYYLVLNTLYTPKSIFSSW